MTDTLGGLLRRARETKGPAWTLDTVARNIGRTATWLSNVETGKTKSLPEPHELRKLGDLLGLTMAEMLEAAGFLRPDDLHQSRVNPFERDDPRWHYVETLKRFDLKDEYDGFVLYLTGKTLQMIDGDRSKITDELDWMKASPKGPIAQES